MDYLVYNADTPTGFYVIERLKNEGKTVLGVTIGDGKGDIYIHPDTNYVSGIDFCVYLSEYGDYEGVYYIVDHDRIYSDFTGDVKEILDLETPTVVIMDWEPYNGVKRGNQPIHSGTPTSPDNFRGISKVWIKNTFERASKEYDFPISILIYPTALSPFSLAKEERIQAEYYLPQIIFEVLEGFKTGMRVPVHRGDLKVHYDILHRSDIAKSAFRLFEMGLEGVHMISSNKVYRLKEIIEILYGRLIGADYILLENTSIEVLGKRRVIENYDTYIDMVYMWFKDDFKLLYSIEDILDEIIRVYNMIESSNEIIENILITS